MINKFLKTISIALAVSAAATFAGCGNDSGSSKTETTKTAETNAVQETTLPEFTTDADLASLHEINYGADEFAGAWTITEGTGSKLESFVFVFDGSEKAYLMIGTMGYIGNYSLDTEADENGVEKKTFATQLLFGLDGKYTYSFSDDKSTVTLTNTADNTTTTMQQIVSYSCIPIPDPEPQIDKALLGAWSDGSGGYLYFDKSGIMYETQKGLSFTFYTYSAKDGAVTSTYIMKEEQTETANYSVDGDTLTYNNYEYTRVSASELV